MTTTPVHLHGSDEIINYFLAVINNLSLSADFSAEARGDSYGCYQGYLLVGANISEAVIRERFKKEEIDVRVENYDRLADDNPTHLVKELTVGKLVP